MRSWEALVAALQGVLARHGAKERYDLTLPRYAEVPLHVHGNCFYCIAWCSGIFYCM